MKPGYRRPEFSHIIDIIEEQSKVLDLGCGDGTLLELLVKEKNVKARGIEIKEELVTECVGKHLTVYHGDIEEAIANYPDASFDYVILNKTLQVTKRPRNILAEMLRVGKQAIVSFPNFAYFQIRKQILLYGRMPKSNALPFEWYETPNIHLTTVLDFKRLCRAEGLKTIREVYIAASDPIPSVLVNMFPNLLAEVAVFVLRK
ncbi:MAG: methionine biosynthesis protein MetW [Thermodesulfobacteriota bacterium]